MIKRSIQLTLENKRIVYKNFLIRLVVYAIFLTISLLIGYFSLLDVFMSLKTPLYNLMDLFREIIGRVFTEGFDIIVNGTIDGVKYSQKIDELWYALHQSFHNQSFEIVWRFLLFLLVFQLKDLVLGIFDYVNGIFVNEHMSSLRHGKFFVLLFDNFKQSILYGVYRYLMLLVFNLLMISLVLFIFIKTVGYLSILSVSICVALVFLLISLRQSLFGQTMARMVCDNLNPWKAFITNFKELKKGNFFINFASYLFLNIVVFVIVVVCSVCTFGVSFLILSPLISILYSTTKFVLYYLENQKKFYINFDNIFVPKSLRQNDENLLNEVDI